MCRAAVDRRQCAFSPIAQHSPCRRSTTHRRTVHTGERRSAYLSRNNLVGQAARRYGTRTLRNKDL